MRVVQRRTVSEKKKEKKENHWSPQDGGTIGVAQVVLGVSIEGSGGSKIFYREGCEEGVMMKLVEAIIGRQIGFDKFGELEVM